MDLGTPEGRRELYDQYRQSMEAIIVASEEHRMAEPACEARPVCIGGANLLAIHEATAIAPEFPVFLVVVAVQEIADLRRRLDIQRQLTAEATKEADRNAEDVAKLTATIEAMVEQGHTD